MIQALTDELQQTISRLKLAVEQESTRAAAEAQHVTRAEELASQLAAAESKCEEATGECRRLEPAVAQLTSEMAQLKETAAATQRLLDAEKEETTRLRGTCFV